MLFTPNQFGGLVVVLYLSSNRNYEGVKLTLRHLNVTKLTFVAYQKLYDIMMTKYRETDNARRT